jgi:5-methylcytosine-specific restriction endonuclease McrA
MNYITNYMKHHDIGEQDIVLCKVCGAMSQDLHHIKFRSRNGNDEPSNLIPLCRPCHNLAHSRALTEEELYERNNNTTSYT